MKTDLTLGHASAIYFPSNSSLQLVPIVEVSFYADEDFPFATRSREEILAENTSYGALWQADGCPGSATVGP